MTGAARPLAYLDHAATTPLRPEAAAAMAAAEADGPGNASSAHRAGRRARQRLEEAREEVAALVGARPAAVVFTSGGTEAANLGVLGPLAGRPGTVVCSAVEHPAVLEAARWAARTGPWTLRLAPVTSDGILDLDALAGLLDPSVVGVSLMAANHEVGTVQPLAEAVALCRRRSPDAVVHTDAVAAAPWLDLAGSTATADLVSLSAHKFGGPTGAGVVVVRRDVALSPLVHGGGQEHERRAGTSHVAGAVGLAAALAATAAARAQESARAVALRDRLGEGLVGLGAVRSAPPPLTLPGHCHVRFTGVDREELLVLLDDAGVCASAGAACASGALEPSHVLAAMGVDGAEAAGAVRFTLGWSSTEDDVDRALGVVPGALVRLRAA